MLQSPQLQKKCGRLSIVLRSRQSQIDFCRRKLMLRSRQSKSFLSRQTQKIFGRRTTLLKKLSITSVAKKCGQRNVLPWSRQTQKFSVAPGAKISVDGHFCFVRASRKNFWSRHARKDFGRQPFVLRSSELQKHAVGGQLDFDRARRKNFQSRQAQ